MQGSTTNKSTSPEISVRYEAAWLKAQLPFSKREAHLLLGKMAARLALLCPGYRPRIRCLFCTDSSMAELNLAYLGVPGPTNTLAFETNGPDNSTDHAHPSRVEYGAGELYFCVPQYLRELTLYGQEPEDYAIFLLAHAMSHLAGLDHGAIMDDISEKLLVAGKQTIAEFQACTA